MSAQLPQEKARELAERAASRLAADSRVHLVYLFGSAVDPDVAGVRDVDLAIWTEPTLSSEELLELRAEAVLAAGGPIDLVSLNHASVVLAREVAESGLCLFARPAEAEVEFVTRARSRYWDFKPFLEVQWRHAGERLENRRRGAQA